MAPSFEKRERNESADQDCRKCAKCGALFRDIGMVMVKRKWYCRNCADELLGE